MIPWRAGAVVWFAGTHHSDLLVVWEHCDPQHAAVGHSLNNASHHGPLAARSCQVAAGIETCGREAPCQCARVSAWLGRVTAVHNVSRTHPLYPAHCAQQRCLRQRPAACSRHIQPVLRNHTSVHKCGLAVCEYAVGILQCSAQLTLVHNPLPASCAVSSAFFRASIYGLCWEPVLTCDVHVCTQIDLLHGTCIQGVHKEGIAASCF